MSIKKDVWQKTAAAGLGFLALGAQISLIRSLLEIFQGNELTVGIFLAAWLTGTAGGALLFSRIAQHHIWQHLPVVGALPIIISSYILIRFLPQLLGFLPLVPQNLLKSILIISLSIIPTAALCGALFPYFSIRSFHQNETDHSVPVNTIYIWESAGSLLAALLLNFVLFQLLFNLQILLICLLLFYVILFFHSYIIESAKKLKYCYLFYLVIIFLLLFTSAKIQQKIHAYTLAPYRVESEKDTPYGNIKLLELEQQKLLLQQGLVVYTLPDPSSAEFHLLPPLLYHPAPRKLLLIGGNLSEFLPYLQQISSLSEIVYLEKDPYLMKFQTDQLMNLPASHQLAITFITKDVRSYFSQENRRFDVICLNEAEPSTLQQNRYYTSEFYQMVGGHLSPDGIFYFTVRSSENYINSPLGKYLNLQRNTLGTVFSALLIIPGDENHFLLSRLPVSNDWQILFERMQQYQITPQFLTPVYIQYRLSPSRLEYYEQQLARWQHSEINHDFNLKGYLYHFRGWGGMVYVDLLNIYDLLYQFRYHCLTILILLFIIVKLTMRKYRKAVLLFNLAFIGGLSLLIEINILLWYQINFGILYSAMALIFGLFMLGLSIGAWWSLKGRLQRVTFRQLYGCYLFLLLVMMITMEIQSWQPAIIWGATYLYQWLLLPLLIFLNGVVSGSFFTRTTSEYFQLNPSSSAGLTYGIDLAGGVLASLAVSVFLAPWFGLMGTIGIALGLVLVFWIFE
jgi:spermidine synthase